MNSETEDAAEKAPRGLWPRVRAFLDSLAGRLLILTATVVLAGEALMFAPALSKFHESWLQARIDLAQTAALALEVAPQDYDVDDDLMFELLENAEVRRIAMKRGEERELILEDGSVGSADLTVFDYTLSPDWATRLGWAFDSFFAPEGRTLRVLARPRFESGEFIEIVLNEAPLKKALYAFAARFALISTLILMAAGGLVFGALNMAFVRPMRDLTRSIEKFREHPEDATIEFVRSHRADEIGRAERAAADMAEQIRMSFRQRERLAALGAAVARIGHDLRNMLATAQLVTERLSKSEDPSVRQVAPRLERAIDRAAALASTTLRYGRADEPAPDMKRVLVAAEMVDAVADGLVGFAGVNCRVAIDDDLAVNADPEHLHRILVNILRNAAQVMRGSPRAVEGIFVHAYRTGGAVQIEVIDHGPGVPEKLRATLFEPFISADRESGGTGLGLAIARELARGMGGEVALLRSTGEGAAFQITLQAA